MDIAGKIIQILPEVGGQSAKGPWKKQEFIIETQEQFPKKVCLSNWNDKVVLTQAMIGSDVQASINLESREYNGRWYTEIRVWKMESMASGSSSSQQMPPPPTDIPPLSEETDLDDMPF
ncbi:MAG: hypothetical protein CVU09_07600 [Bacteroidetes bacterium HGW-Bacteroidetes-4]|jgi:hypothetical protein|nr:MAG: hypothetical protein CVU09_07600 [Bacteroidetes bacterium HGW-Bacteroidetes-4]